MRSPRDAFLVDGVEQGEGVGGAGGEGFEGVGFLLGVEACVVREDDRGGLGIAAGREALEGEAADGAFVQELLQRLGESRRGCDGSSRACGASRGPVGTTFAVRTFCSDVTARSSPNRTARASASSRTSASGLSFSIG